MARLTIRLVSNLETGKKDILIDLASDPDALPVEHERDHRNLVRQLLGKGILEPHEVGEVRVSRGAPQSGSGATGQAAEPGEESIPAAE